MGDLRAILVTGTVGVGKTSVLLEIGGILSRGTESYALCDLDWLAWLRPDPGVATTVQDVLAENLRHVTATFRAAGVTRLVLARAVSRASEVETIRASLTPAELVVIRLVASARVVEQRLARRDSGSTLAEHLAEARSFAAEGEAAGIGAASISTDELEPPAIAHQVLVRAGWRSDS